MYKDKPTEYGFSNMVRNIESDETGTSVICLLVLQACVMDCDKIRHDLCNTSVRVSVVAAFAPCKIHLMNVIS